MCEKEELKNNFKIFYFSKCFSFWWKGGCFWKEYFGVERREGGIKCLVFRYVEFELFIIVVRGEVKLGYVL